mmetsp:Transcript_38903/g.90500  ORF Transcript_38903/g.90500 Transcript_38903/m.90500 type:complete len:128 (+) Transcript_38903:980-1363(+)
MEMVCKTLIYIFALMFLYQKERKNYSILGEEKYSIILYASSMIPKSSIDNDYKILSSYSASPFLHKQVFLALTSISPCFLHYYFPDFFTYRSFVLIFKLFGLLHDIICKIGPELYKIIYQPYIIKKN